MKTLIITCIAAVAILMLFTQCNNTNSQQADAGGKKHCDTCLSYAIYGEYARDSNKRMKDSLNRRVFNIVEQQHGTDIALQSDGSILLQKGTYRISGFSMVSMEVNTKVEFQKANYPGYCLVYLEKDEKTPAVLKNNIGLGSLATSDQASASLFDLIYTCDSTREICVGHQSGNDLGSANIYLSVFMVDNKDTSDYHVAARIAITKMY